RSPCVENPSRTPDRHEGGVNVDELSSDAAKSRKVAPRTESTAINHPIERGHAPTNHDTVRSYRRNGFAETAHDPASRKGVRKLRHARPGVDVRFVRGVKAYAEARIDFGFERRDRGPIEDLRRTRCPGGCGAMNPIDVAAVAPVRDREASVL